MGGGGEVPESDTGRPGGDGGRRSDPLRHIASPSRAAPVTARAADPPPPRGGRSHPPPPTTPAGSFAPARRASVGNQSSRLTVWRSSPGGSVPGQQAKAGTRMPPSYRLPFQPRHGRL